jgi:hypothetical protein
MKTMAFKGRDPVRSKIVINNNTAEQKNTFNYLHCSISYHSEKDTLSHYLLYYTDVKLGQLENRINLRYHQWK